MSIPPLSTEVRFLIWIIAGICGFFVAIISAEMSGKLGQIIRQITPGEPKQGRPQRKRSTFLWITLILSAFVAIVSTAIASSAPPLREFFSLTPSPIFSSTTSAITASPIPSTFTPSPTIIPSITPTPTSTTTPTPVAMAFNKIDIYKTGLTGGPCGYSKMHSIVRDLDGKLHLYFSKANDNNPATIYESISSDEGKTWSPEQMVTGFDVKGKIVGFSCSAAVDANNVIHLVFDLAASDIGYTRWSRTEGWRRPVIRAQGDKDVGAYAANIAVGPGVQVHSVWSSKRVWYTFYDGTSWSSETEIAAGGWHPDIFVDSAGGRHVVFNGAGLIPDKSGKGESPVTVYYTYSSDGVHWTEPVTIPPDEYIWEAAASIKVDRTGRRHVTYIKWAQLEGDLYYTYSDDGKAWSQPLQLNDQPGVQTGTDGNESASMILDENDNLFVVWKGLGGAGQQKTWGIYLRWLNKATDQWSDVIQISDKIDGGVGGHPSLPYHILPGGDRNTFILDMVWGYSGDIYYGRVEFKNSGK